MSKGAQNSRETHADSLREKFESNIGMIEKAGWQDQKDFILEVPVNLQNDCVVYMVKKRNQISLMKIY